MIIDLCVKSHEVALQFANYRAHTLQHQKSFIKSAATYRKTIDDLEATPHFLFWGFGSHIWRGITHSRLYNNISNTQVVAWVGANCSLSGQLVGPVRYTTLTTTLLPVLLLKMTSVRGTSRVILSEILEIREPSGYMVLEFSSCLVWEFRS